MSVGAADPISEMFPDVMRSNIFSAVYKPVARRAFKLWGEWNLNGNGGWLCGGKGGCDYLALGFPNFIFDFDWRQEAVLETDHAQQNIRDTTMRLKQITL